MTDCSKYEPIFGAWYIKKKIGAGSFGEVYEIERKEFGKVYRSALKVMSVPFNDDEIRAMRADGTSMEAIATYYEGVVQDIAEENAIMSELRGNSHIVSYEDHQIIRHEDGVGYDILIRMELLTSLIDHLLHNPMTETDVIKLGKDLCQALIVCEQKKIIHRDIKPGNIFLSDTGDYKLGDFGIARSIEKSTGELSRKGTFTYMAPEVYKGEKYGVGADIYSLGMVMYYLLNCRRMPFLPLPPEPVSYNQKMDALRRRMEGERFQPPHEANPVLSEIVMTACAYDPEDRFLSAEAFLNALETVEGGNRSLRHGATAGPQRTSGQSRAFPGEEKTELLHDMQDHTGTGTGGRQNTWQGTWQNSWQEGSARRGWTGTTGMAGTAGMTGTSGTARTAGMAGTSGTARTVGTAGGGYYGPDGYRSSVKKSKPAKNRKIPLIAAAVVVVLAGGIFGMNLVKGGDGDGPGGNKMVLTADDIEIQGKDINFSQLTHENVRGWTMENEGVDILIKVKNKGSVPLRAFTYHLKKKGSDEYLTNLDFDSEYKDSDKFLAIGYVEAGETDFMYTKLHLDNDTETKGSKARLGVEDVVAEGSLGDYKIPGGEMMRWNKGADVYPVKVRNDNEEPIHSGAAVLLLRKRLASADSFSNKWGAGLLTTGINGDTEQKQPDIIYNPGINGTKESNAYEVRVFDPYYLADPDFPDNAEETTEE